MKKFITFIFLGLIAYFLITGIYDIDGFEKYGEATLENRVSRNFLDSSVNDLNEAVVYGESKDLEAGSANAVTKVVAMYRSFDTLGEVTVLFVSALGISMLLGSGTEIMRGKYNPNFILRVGAKVVLPLIIVVGSFIFTHGHLTPGGGFPGGSMIASGVLLMYLADPSFRIKLKSFKVTESFAGMAYVGVGLAGLLVGSYFLENIINTGTVGNLFSAGIVPIVYVLVGLKVGSELTGVISDFLKEEVVE